MSWLNNMFIKLKQLHFNEGSSRSSPKMIQFHGVKFFILNHRKVVSFRLRIAEIVVHRHFPRFIIFKHKAMFKILEMKLHENRSKDREENTSGKQICSLVGNVVEILSK